jgi:protein TIF31
MLQSLREFQASLPWFEKALALCIQIHGKDSINAAAISYQYSQALGLASDPISAVPKMRDAYTIFARELGPEDRVTKETAALLQHFTATAVNVAKQAKLGKKVAAPNVSVTAEVQPVGPEANGIGSRGLQNIDELVKYIGAIDVGTTSAQKTVQKKRRGGKR